MINNILGVHLVKVEKRAEVHKTKMKRATKQMTPII